MRSIVAHRLRWVIGGVIVTAVLCLAAAVVAAVGRPTPEWGLAGLVVLGIAAGYHLQVVYRVGSQRLILVWCQAAAAVALVLEPAPWMVLTTAAGWAVTTFGPGGLRPMKACYNTALNTVAAACAAVVYRVIHPGPLHLTSWTDPGAVLVAMLVFSTVVEIGVPGAIAAASSRSFVSTFMDGAATRCLQVAADLTLAVAAAAAAVAAPRLLIAVPVVGGLIHLGYRSAAAARLEWRFAQRLIAAIGALGAGEQDRTLIARRAAEQTVRLLRADTVELMLHGDPPVLARHTLSGQAWSGPPTDAGHVHGQVAEVCSIGEAGQTLGELRVFFAAPVRLGDRERSSLAILAGAVGTALRTAAAHADLEAMAAAAEHAATHDTITKLPARQPLQEWIAAHLDAVGASGTDTPVALIFLNIKGFAEILSEFAPEVADQLLIHAATQLAAGVGQTERLAHVGGDTFALWIPAAGDVDDVRERADHLLTVLSTPAVVESGPVVLSGVAGVVYAQPSSLSGAEQMLRQARAALRAGHRSRQPVTVYHAEDDTRGQSALVLTSELRTALRKGQLELAYQPVLELATGNPIAVEAVPQWVNPSSGLLWPEEWMPVLEQSELVGHYLLWLLEEALNAHRDWYRHGLPTPVAVRLPSPALLDPALPGTVAAALSRAGVTPSRLIIEVAGNWMLSAADVVERVLEELAEHGVTLSVDMAGLSLEQLCAVPASHIKLSSHTTDDLLSDQEARARVSGIVAFADELGLQVIAQDIPTLEHLNALIALRVHAGEGPCLSHPRHAEEIVGALQVASELALSARDAKVITLPVRDRSPDRPT